MKIRILNYLPKNRDGSWIDNGIALWSSMFNPKTWRKPELVCAHGEVWTQDDHGFQAGLGKPWINSPYYGTCRTSTMRKPFNGVCSRSASSVLRHPERWTYFEIDVDDRWYKKFVAEMDEKVRRNLGYDKVTILSFFWPWRYGNSGQYICSEFVHESILGYICDQQPLFANLMKLKCPSPLRLAHELHRSGHDLYSLETGKVILKGMS